MTFRVFILGVIATFAFNLVWENAQGFLFANYSGPLQHFWSCLVGTLGDLVIVAGIYGAVAFLWRDLAWYRQMSMGQVACVVVLGGTVAVVIETHALASGRWAYNGMPLVPLTGIGLAPVLQMIVLPPIVFFLMRFGNGVRARRAD